MIKRILLGLGGTSFTPVAIRHGVELARQHDAHLTGVTVIDEQRLSHVGPTPIGAGGAAEELREHRLEVTQQQIEEAIAEFEGACREAGVPYTVDRERGDEFDLMVSAARYHDLMIFGLRSLFDCGLGIDPPDALARLLGQGVRPIVAVAEEYRPIRRVLLAYSGSQESAKTIKRFVQMRLWGDVATRLVVYHGNKEKAQRRLENMAEYCRAHSLEPEMQHVMHSPSDDILAQADEWDADLIVMGNSVRNYLLRKKIFGETTLHVMKHSRRPLFLSY